jgi:hypothetical protein
MLIVVGVFASRPAIKEYWDSGSGLRSTRHVPSVAASNATLSSFGNGRESDAVHRYRYLMGVELGSALHR